MTTLTADQPIKTDLVCQRLSSDQQAMFSLDRQQFAIFVQVVQSWFGARPVLLHRSYQIVQGLEQQLGLERLRGLA